MAVESTTVSGERPASSSTSTPGGLTVPVERTRKRSLTVSAPSPTDTKKTKVAPPPLPVAPQAPVEVVPATTSTAADEVPQDKAEPATDAKKVPWSKMTDKEKAALVQQPKTYRLPGDGPHVFFVFEECLIRIFEGERESGDFFVLKSVILEAAEKKAKQGKSEDNEDEDEDPSIENFIEQKSGWWEPAVVEETLESAEAEKLLKLWGKLKLPKDDGYYEVTVQKEKPAEGVPAVEIKWEDMYLDWHTIAEDHQCSWWITDVSVPDAESAKAAKIISDHVPMYFVV